MILSGTKGTSAIFLQKIFPAFVYWTGHYVILLLQRCGFRLSNLILPYYLMNATTCVDLTWSDADYAQKDQLLLLGTPKQF